MPNPGGNAPEVERPRREPAIRTMRSDISEFLKTTKPSLVSLLARQAEWEAYAPPSRRRIWIGAAIAAVAAAAVVTGAVWYLRSGPEVPEAAAPPPAPPFLFFEATTELTVPPAPSSLYRELSLLPDQPVGSFSRILIRTARETGDAAIPDLAEFIARAGGRIPADLEGTAIGQPQLFRYRSSAGTDLGLMFETRNPARAIAALIGAEPSLARDLEFLFLGTTPPVNLSPYQDLIYRNVSFRYLKLFPEQDRGLGYLLFPARRLMVISTSEGALRAAIDRLFEGR